MTSEQSLLSSTDIRIQKDIVSNLLLSMGFDLVGPLSASLIMGATDVLVLAELARTLPSTADFAPVVELMFTFSESQPIEVRLVQQAVIESLSENEMLGTGISLQRIEFLSEHYIEPHLEEAAHAL